MAVYRLPETETINVLAQKHSKLTKATGNSSRKGFLFAPFHETQNCAPVLIASDIFTSSEGLPSLTFADKLTESKTTKEQKAKVKAATKDQFIAYIKHIQKEIKNGTFKKVVAARVVKAKKPKAFNAVAFFRALCKKYPAAFISMVYTPQHGLWIGATPEILLNVDKGGFKTYSLAGTKANTPKNAGKDWGTKEQDEQKIVSQYITDAFKKVTGSKPEIKGPETIAAGNLLHLRTTFTYHKLNRDKWQNVIAGLHPTPAVAGLPKKESIEFIQKHEVADRGFYSGYLGPVNVNGQINLFVNLRCMQVLKNKLAVHVGCGITANSVPNDEWKESKMKSETLLSVLKPAKK